MSESDRPTAEWLLSARAVKHEMSNILMGVQGHIDLLEDYPELRDKSTRKIRLIREQLRRMQDQLDALNKICR